MNSKKKSIRIFENYKPYRLIVKIEEPEPCAVREWNAPFVGEEPEPEEPF